MSSSVYGIHAVTAALRRPGAVQELLIAEDGRMNPRLTKLLDQARNAGVTLRKVKREALDDAAQGERHQGIVAMLGAAAEAPVVAGDLDDLLEGLDHPPFLLVLDGVQDPHNLGACLRSADAAGVDAVIVPKDKAAGLTPVVRKVACGAAENVPFFQVTNLARTLRDLQERGIWLIGAAGEAEGSLYQADLRGPLALVMGAEEQGMRRLTREHCDLLVSIPMSGSVSSLNVSVATGICLFEAVRQRKCK